MAAITLPTSVKPTANTKFAPLGTLGATTVVGNSLYQDAADSKWKLCASNSTLAVGTLKGIAFTAGVDTDYVLVAIGGDIVMVGSTLAVGVTYGVGTVAGSIVPTADFVATNYVNTVGIATTTTKMSLGIKASLTQFA